MNKAPILRNLLPGVADLPPMRGVAVFIVGEQLNSNKTDQDRLACTGTFMTTIMDLACIPRTDQMTYLRATSMRRNLFRPGQALNAENAAEGAALLMDHFQRYQEHYGAEVQRREVLLCGAWARMAFNLRGEYGRQSQDHGSVTWIPHPSGKNRFWNNPESKGRAARLVELVFNHVL